MDNESRERLVRVEEGVKHIAILLKEHCDQPCPQLGCTFKQDIVSLRITQKWTRIVGRTAVGAMIIAVITYLIPKFIGIIGGVDGL